MNAATAIQPNYIDTDPPPEAPCTLAPPRVGERLQGICTITAELFDVALAALIVHDVEQGWEILSAGRLSHLPIPREASASFHAIASGKPLIVPDTHYSTTHGQHRGVEPAWQMRFFAAMPLELDVGIGAICLLDRRPRNLGGRQRRLLEEVARLCDSILARAVDHPGSMIVSRARVRS